MRRLLAIGAALGLLALGGHVGGLDMLFGPARGPGTGSVAERSRMPMAGFHLPAAETRVADGDSLQYGDRRIRLSGIDAPELRQDCFDRGGAAIPCGRLAQEALGRLVRAGGGRLSCTDEGNDRFGRTLSVCTNARGEQVNRAMVREGWALSRRDGPGFQAEQQAAEAERRGIHAWRFEPPEDWRRDQSRR